MRGEPPWGAPDRKYGPKVGTIDADRNIKKYY
jgi:hypothetical protein